MKVGKFGHPNWHGLLVRHTELLHVCTTSVQQVHRMHHVLFFMFHNYRKIVTQISGKTQYILRGASVDSCWW